MNMKNEVGGEERFRKEKAKGRKLRQSQWWKEKVSKGVCHYCAGEFTPVSLTMDHIVPIARGGKSTKGNVVPSWKKWKKIFFFGKTEICLKNLKML